MAERIHGFNERNARRIARAVRKSEGPERSLNAKPSPAPAFQPLEYAYRIMVEIISSEAADNPAQNRWKYTVTQVTKTAAGYDGFEKITEDDADEFGGIWQQDAYNYFEDMNDDTGVESVGVDVDGTDFPAGMSIQALPAGLICPADVLFVGGGDGTREIWLYAPNGIDGTC